MENLVHISNISKSSWLVVYLGGFLLLPLLLFRWYHDPLRGVPGPFIARWTGVWIILLDLSGRRGTTVHKLHKKYGPVVRLAPDQLSFDSPEALKHIYSANSKFPKAPVYDSLGFQSTFTTRDQHNYRGMKKRIIPSFSPSATSALEPVLHRQIGNLIKCFDKRVDQPLDVLPWFRMLALSVVGEGFIGDSFSGLETEQTPKLLDEIDSVFPTLWVWWMFPFLSIILQYCPIPGVRNFLRAADEFRKYCILAYRKYLATQDPRERNDLIARMINEQTELLDQKQILPRHLTEDGIIDELTNLIFAGTDTTGNTLAYLFWQLSHHPEWQARLREEIREVLGDRSSFKYDMISEFPVLEAVLQETFRVHPAALSGLQRLVPSGGAVINGIPVPAGSIVSCQAFSSQRDAAIFPDPDRFYPQRWLDADKAGTTETLRNQFMVFGKGARACLGQRLAIMELKCCIVAMISRYDFAIGSQRTDEDMEMTDHIVLVPKGQRCILKVKKVEPLT